MPTGYTADVQSGKVTDFKTFALQCARAFGALILMRDDPADAPIPDAFEPSDYHVKGLAAARARLAELRAMTVAQGEAAAEQSFKEATSRQRKYDAEKAEQRARYEAMIAKVEAWTPPTHEHVHMKEFMLQQLRDSVKFDCEGSYWEQPKLLTGAEWLKAETAEANRLIEYHAVEDEKERNRAASRSAWVRELKASLLATPAA